MKPPFPVGTIDSFPPKTPYFLFSNFSDSLVNYEGVAYMTIEHAYQAAKTTDLSIRLRIAGCTNPAQAKRIGKTLQLRPDWDKMKLDIMYELLVQKFAKGSFNSKALNATGDALMIEGNWWHDLFWGQCSCDRHNWDGANHLGGLLMRIRDENRRS